MQTSVKTCGIFIPPPKKKKKKKKRKKKEKKDGKTKYPSLDKPGDYWLKT